MSLAARAALDERRHIVVQQLQRRQVDVDHVPRLVLAVFDILLERRRNSFVSDWLELHDVILNERLPRFVILSERSE